MVTSFQTNKKPQIVFWPLKWDLTQITKKCKFCPVMQKVYVHEQCIYYSKFSHHNVLIIRHRCFVILMLCGLMYTRQQPPWDLCLTFVFHQEPFNAPVGNYNSFQHPMGGGQPPQLPTSPPTYESVSDWALQIRAPLLSPQTDKQTGWGTNQGRTIYSACFQFCLPSALYSFSEWACFIHMAVQLGPYVFGHWHNFMILAVKKIYSLGYSYLFTLQLKRFTS